MTSDNLSPLTSEEWANHHNQKHVTGLARNVRGGDFSVQTLEMLRMTRSGERTLEVGSGSGETSLALQMKGCIATALDFTESCLQLTKEAGHELGVEVRTVLADATKALPFSENEFDVVFQAGLLEHFNRDQRIEMLRSWGRAGKKMVSIIPNSASIGYRVGMARLKARGQWQYGLELPQFTLQGEFREAGFRVVEEYTIGEESALTFLPRWHPLRWMLRYWIRTNPAEDNCHQGYLLVTVGMKIE